MRITRGEEASQAQDQRMLHVLAPLDEIAIASTSSAGEIAELEIREDTAQYWLISMDVPGGVQYKPGDKIEVSCHCNRGDGGCDVAFMKQRNNLNATCVPRPGCQDCKMVVTVIKSGQRVSGGAVVLKASRVEVE